MNIDTKNLWQCIELDGDELFAILIKEILL